MIPKRYLLVLVATVAALAGCGSGHSTPGSAAGPTTSRAATTAPTPAGAGSCAGVVATVKQHPTSSAVTDVTVEGGCTSVSVLTSLADDKTSAARDLCDTAAEVAYVGKTSSIRVIGASGKEMSIGLSSARCIGEP